MWLSGYRRTLEGTPFTYHSIAPEIRSALLVRGNDERPTVAWETAAVEAGDDADVVQFVWVFAMAASPDEVPFTLYVNEQSVLTFHTPLTAAEDTWTVHGDRGASLRFRVTHRDRHGDPMGFALLRLPADGLERGRGVALRVRSTNRGSPAWFMVYEYETTESIEVDPLPRVRRAEGDGVQWIRLRCTHLGDDADIRVRHEGQEVARGVLPFGQSELAVPLPAATEPRDVDLEIDITGRAVQPICFRQEPIKQWTIYLVQHTHTDIGYTRPQTEILPEHLRFIDYALDFCDATDGVEDDARFRWTCEASWPVREYVRSRPPAQLDRLRRRVEEGSIELTGLMFNLSELPDEAALLAMLEPLKRLNEAGLRVRMAMQNDVNGLAWALADALPSVGIDAFIMGQHSHRALACFERPTAFWWSSPSGTRMLGYRGDHYMTGNEWGLHGTDDEAFADGLFHHLDELRQLAYPFDRAAVQYGGYLTDNAPPSLRGPEMIRRWNETWAWPRLRSATASEFLDWVRDTHADEIPVHRAAWPDWWTDGFGSAARETAAARRTHGELLAVQALTAVGVARGLGTPPRWVPRVQAAYDALLFYDEHTLGAAESISDPQCENSIVQWALKAAYVWDAVKRSRILLEAVLGWLVPSLPSAADAQLIVLNPLAWPRGGEVEVYVDHATLPPEQPFYLLDPEGREVRAQPLRRRADGTTWLLYVPRVPALGYVSLRVAASEEATRREMAVPSTTLENRWYVLEVDEEDGRVSRLIDKDLGIDLVDPKASWGLFAPIYERLGDRHQLERKTLTSCKRLGLSDVRVEPGPPDETLQSVIVTGTLPGGTPPAGVRLEVRLFHETKRIQLACTMQKVAVEDPEAVYVAFPFRLPGGQIRYDVPGGAVVPGRDQLPGSASDWNTVQNYVCITNEDAEVVLSSDGAPLWQLGGLNLGQFRYEAAPAAPHVYSWVMNNYWVTNFCASQEGEFHWHYDLTSHAPGAPSKATRFGWNARVPLVARVVPPGREARGTPTGSLFEAALPEGLVLAGVRPTDDGRALFLHVREVDGRPAVLDLRELVGPNRLESVRDVDALGRDVGEAGESLTFAPHGVRFLRLELGREPDSSTNSS